jgi:nucleoside-diphosphate-sugar epimerase
MRILVTGATGFIGQHLVNKLSQAGHTVIILSRQSQSPQSLAGISEKILQQLDHVYGDLRNFNLMSRAVRDATPDIVIHLAAAGVSDPFLSPHRAIRNNVTGTINLLRACFENKSLSKIPTKVIVGRTPGEFEPSNVYAASKSASWKFCEMFVRSQGWPIIGAMIFQTYGSGQPSHMLVPGAIEAALNGNDYPMTSGKQTRDWIHVSDVAKALSVIISSQNAPGESIDVGTGTATSVAEVVELIFALTKSSGSPAASMLPDRIGETNHPVADATKTYNETGWRALLSIKEGLRETIKNLAPIT